LNGIRIQFPVVEYNASAIPPPHDPKHAYRDCGCGPFQCAWLAFLQCRDDRGNLVTLPLCEAPANESDTSLFVGTRTEACFNCKRYYRTWALCPELVKSVSGDIAISPVVVRRTPLPSMTASRHGGGGPALRIRRLMVHSWCTSVLSTQGYRMSLRR
ncbi:hypothetical protein BV20DRAFT_914053, partial [Pilatotrama ljubarskyi]